MAQTKKQKQQAAKAEKEKKNLMVLGGTILVAIIAIFWLMG